MATTLQERTKTLLKESGETHQGVFLTGPDKIELLSVELPESVIFDKLELTRYCCKRVMLSHKDFK